MTLTSSRSIPALASPSVRAEPARSLARPLATIRFDWAIVAASGWFVGGSYVDGWAHNNLPSLETFFTPWHAALYSGFLVAMGVLGWGVARNRANGRSWWLAIPAGYEVSLLGGLIFLAGGIADMLWHTVFGIEVDVDALLSPTHLSLLLGGTLFLAGPARADARRRAAGRQFGHWQALLPRLMALTYVLAALAFFTQYANLWGGPWLASVYRPLANVVVTAGGGRDLSPLFLLQAVGVAGVLVQSALLAGFALVAVRQGRVPAGGFTLMIGLYVVLTVLMRQKHEAGMQLPLATAGLLTGVAADLLYATLRPSPSRPLALQTFVTLLPAIATAAGIGAVAATLGVWWTIHLWAGAVLLAAGTGWLVGLVSSPSTAVYTVE